jgi:hypothetical protein
MFRQLIVNNSIKITNPNFSYDPVGIIDATVQDQFAGKLMSNYIVESVKVDHIGLTYPTTEKKIIAIADVSLNMNVFLVPKYCILHECAYVSMNEAVSDQTYHEFMLVNDDIPQELISHLRIIVLNNGLTSDEIKKLANMSAGDIIPLFVIQSNGYKDGAKIACIAKPNFDDRFTPTFVFTSKMLETKKFDKYGKLEADKRYILSHKKLLMSSNSALSNIIDFLDVDQLVEYIDTLTNL